MFELIANGPAELQGWRLPLAVGNTYQLGRATGSALPVPWDPLVSRTQATLVVTADGISVERLAGAVNPLYVGGEETDGCRLVPGDLFVVGETSFHLILADPDSSTEEARPIEAQTFDRRQLQQVQFPDPEKRLDVLTHLPGVIWGSRSDEELFERLTTLLLAGVSHAEAAAVVALEDNDDVKVLRWNRRHETAGSVQASWRLVRTALHPPGHSELYTWDPEASGSKFTELAEFNWAYCTPVRNVPGERWGLYVAGQLPGQAAGPDRLMLEADVKYTELVAAIISAVRRINRLERQRAGFAQFFAPAVLEALGSDFETELLEPRECDVTVMFSDLRGFSGQAEESADDLLGLLDRVSRILGVITREVHAAAGVVGDFQGDAALAFWGWPFADEDATLQACRSALAVRRSMREAAVQPDHPLAGFSLGIGIAHGRAVAGKMGTTDQVKVTVFGPVVNVASRLETMTRQMQVPILIDEATAEQVAAGLAPDEARTRRIARVLPKGLTQPLTVSELLPPAADWPELTDDHIEQFELGVDHFIAGRWDDAHGCLRGMPVSDHAADFLIEIILRYKRVPPADWAGVVRLDEK